MLITCDGSADYSDAITEFNTPGREVRIVTIILLLLVVVAVLQNL